MPHLVPIAQMGKLIPGEESLAYDRIASEGNSWNPDLSYLD